MDPRHNRAELGDPNSLPTRKRQNDVYDDQQIQKKRGINPPQNDSELIPAEVTAHDKDYSNESKQSHFNISRRRSNTSEMLDQPFEQTAIQIASNMAFNDMRFSNTNSDYLETLNHAPPAIMNDHQHEYMKYRRRNGISVENLQELQRAQSTMPLFPVYGDGLLQSTSISQNSESNLSYDLLPPINQTPTIGNTSTSPRRKSDERRPSVEFNTFGGRRGSRDDTQLTERRSSKDNSIFTTQSMDFGQLQKRRPSKEDPIPEVRRNSKELEIATTETSTNVFKWYENYYAKKGYVQNIHRPVSVFDPTIEGITPSTNGVADLSNMKHPNIRSSSRLFGCDNDLFSLKGREAFKCTIPSAIAEIADKEAAFSKIPDGVHIYVIVLVQNPDQTYDLQMRVLLNRSSGHPGLLLKDEKNECVVMSGEFYTLHGKVILGNNKTGAFYEKFLKREQDLQDKKLRDNALNANNDLSPEQLDQIKAEPLVVNAILNSKQKDIFDSFLKDYYHPSYANNAFFPASEEDDDTNEELLRRGFPKELIPPPSETALKKKRDKDALLAQQQSPFNTVTSTISTSSMSHFVHNDQDVIQKSANRVLTPDNPVDEKTDTPPKTGMEL